MMRLTYHKGAGSFRLPLLPPPPFSSPSRLPLHPSPHGRPSPPKTPPPALLYA